LHRSYQRLVPHGNEWWNEYCCQTQMIRQCILPPPLECYLKCLSNVLTPHTQEFPWLVWHVPSCNCCDVTTMPLTTSIHMNPLPLPGPGLCATACTPTASSLCTFIVCSPHHPSHWQMAASQFMVVTFSPFNPGVGPLSSYWPPCFLSPNFTITAQETSRVAELSSPFPGI